MSRAILKGSLAACCLFLTVPAAIAHHSFASVFGNQSITLKGTVTELQWVNPHAYAHVALKKDGKTEDWVVELGYINGLIQSGWTREKVKAGDPLTITGWLAKTSAVGYLKATADPSGQPRLIRLRDAEFSDGSKFTAAGSTP